MRYDVSKLSITGNPKCFISFALQYKTKIHYKYFEVISPIC